MKIYRDKDYGTPRGNDPESRPAKYATREDFCCDGLFKSNSELDFSTWNGVDLILRVIESDVADLEDVKFCPFCGEKFEVINR